MTLLINWNMIKKSFSFFFNKPQLQYIAVLNKEKQSVLVSLKQEWISENHIIAFWKTTVIKNRWAEIHLSSDVTDTQAPEEYHHRR